MLCEVAKMRNDLVPTLCICDFSTCLRIAQDYCQTLISDI